MPKKSPFSAVTRRPLLWLLLLALALRLFQLTYHSLWFDEVMSCFWAAKPAAEIWRVGLSLTQDKHPPLYYLLLHAWSNVFGVGDASVRSLGAILGALAVLPAYGIGLRLGNRRSAGLGALFVALNPFLVWYSQEARMFMPATTFALVGLYGILLVCGISDPAGADASSPSIQTRGAAGRRRDAIIGGLCAVAGLTGALYSYLFSAFLMPVAGVWVLLRGWQGRRDPNGRRAFWLGAAALAGVAALFAPLAVAAWRVSGGESAPGTAFGGMGSALWRLLQTYTLGWPDWPSFVTTTFAAVLGIVALIGIVVPADGIRGANGVKQAAAPSILLAVWIGLPVLTGGLLLARDATIFSETRYFIFLVPALCIAWGRALGMKSITGRISFDTKRWLALAGVLLVAGCSIAALPSNWSPENRKEAWREAAQLIAQLAGPNDAIVIHADYLHLAFERYFEGPQDIFFPFTDVVDALEEVDPPLAGMSRYDAVWVVQSHNESLDPGNLLLGWYGARFPMITEAFPAGIAIHGFAQRYRVNAVADGTGEAEDAAFDDLLFSTCERLPASLDAQDSLYHAPSGWVHVTSYWSTTARQETDHYPIIQLIDDAGEVWGQSLERRNDAAHIWPTSRWEAGEYVRLDQDVNLNPVTPPGEYRLRIQVPGLTGEAWCGSVVVR